MSDDDMLVKSLNATQLHTHPLWLKKQNNVGFKCFNIILYILSFLLFFIYLKNVNVIMYRFMHFFMHSFY